MLAVRTQSFVEEIFFVIKRIFFRETEQSEKIPLTIFSAHSQAKRTLDLSIFSSCFSFFLLSLSYPFCTEKIPKMIFMFFSAQSLHTFFSVCSKSFFFSILFRIDVNPRIFSSRFESLSFKLL